MSINDPLIKELKGFAGSLLKPIGKVITDKNETLYPFCMCVETIFQSGLSCSTSSLGFSRIPQSWIWLEQLAEQYAGVPFAYLSSVDEVRNSKNVTSSAGKLRLLIRTCLVKKCLHVPVEFLIHHKAIPGLYTSGSVLSDEIRGEIILSTLMPCSLFTFNLDLSNSSFLDQTWILPYCITMEFVPCKVLGLTLKFVSGRALIMNVEEGSVAAENVLIKAGDILDELNGIHITNSTRKKLSSIMKKSDNKPVTAKIIKAFLQERDKTYPPILSLLCQAHIDPNDLVRLNKKTALSQNCVKKISKDAPSSGIPVLYIGAVPTGNKGDVKQIMPAIAEILKKNNSVRKPVLIEILEIGIRVLDEVSETVLQKPSYMEISSCGLAVHFPNYFAYISGEKSCSTAKSFTCYIFYSTNEKQVQTILRCIGQGFQRTHFAV